MDWATKRKIQYFSMIVGFILVFVVLPFYAFIDMLETSLNVWSDIAVTAIVDKDLKQEEAVAAASCSA